MSASLSPPEGKDELIIVREFRAPRALVFKAWTDAAMLPRWCGRRRPVRARARHDECSVASALRRR